MKKDEIQNAALNIFAHKGFSDSTMNEIADVAGLKKATLYFYFKSKDELHSIIMKDIADSYLLVIEKYHQPTSKRDFRKYIIGSIYYGCHRSLYKRKAFTLEKKTILASL